MSELGARTFIQRIVPNLIATIILEGGTPVVIA